MTVTPSDVAVSLGRPITGDDELLALQLIDDALLLIGNRLGDVAELDQPTLDYVVREAVVARMRNPEGFQSETIDDYTYRHAAETRRITILEEWWRLLDPDIGSGAFSARPYFVPDTLNTTLDWS